MIRTTRRLAFVITFAAAGLLAAGPVAGSEESGKSPPLSPETVKLLAGTCTTCHGPDGQSKGVMPALAGQPYRVLHAQMLSFKSDEMPDATVMPRLLKGYDDRELEALARYFSAIGAGK